LYENRDALLVPLFKSVLHNSGVVIVGLGVAFLGTKLDLLLGVRDFSSAPTTVLGSVLLIVEFLLRVWATFYFYRKRMKVISLSPQRILITSGPYRFSRNPLYLGGNVLVFLGQRCSSDRRPRFSLRSFIFPSSIFSFGGRKGNWRGISVESGWSIGNGYANGSSGALVPEPDTWYRVCNHRDCFASLAMTPQTAIIARSGATKQSRREV
jgi:hypothetical protein